MKKGREVDKKLVWCAFSGFVILSSFGLLLRLMSVTALHGLNYSNILHAHSHFAFSGWMFFALSLLIIRIISPDMLRSFRLFFVLMLIGSFGMLVSFSIEGYKATSITFSTLFIFLGYFLTFRLLRDKNLKSKLSPVAFEFIKWALIFLCISSLGPFALGLLAAKGLKASTHYNNSIYFYLHFQMNGWMLLSALGLVAQRYFKEKAELAVKWVKPFIISVIPLYFIFTLWSSPPPTLRVIAVLAAFVHLLSWLKILKSGLSKSGRFPFLLKAALLAVSLKIIFQVLICIPSVGTWVFSNRNLIIGYIHLLVLGGVTPVILQQFEDFGLIAKPELYKRINVIYISSVILYLVLLFLQPLLALADIHIPGLHVTLTGISAIFATVGIAYLTTVFKRPLSG